MVPAEAGRFGEPGTRHHCGSRGNQPGVEQVFVGGQAGLAHANIVGMDNYDAVLFVKTEFLQRWVHRLLLLIFKNSPVNFAAF